jgi:hypothetical protein
VKLVFYFRIVHNQVSAGMSHDLAFELMYNFFNVRSVSYQQQGISVVHSPLPASSCCHLVPLPPHSPPLLLLRRDLKIVPKLSNCCSCSGDRKCQHTMEHSENCLWDTYPAVLSWPPTTHIPACCRHGRGQYCCCS